MGKVVDIVIDALGETGEKASILSEYMIFGGLIGLLVLAPFLIGRPVLQWSETALPVAFHSIVLLVFFAVLLWWAWLISGNRGSRLFGAAYKKGIKWPFLFSIALLLFAIPCFASLTSTLSDHDLVKFEPAIPPKDFSRVQDFYGWHFLNSIPSLSVPETLGWEKPYKHANGLARVLLLAFKLIVIVPVIGSFTVWSRIRKQEKKAKGKSLAAKPANP